MVTEGCDKLLQVNVHIRQTYDIRAITRVIASERTSNVRHSCDH